MTNRMKYWGQISGKRRRAKSDVLALAIVLMSVIVAAQPARTQTFTTIYTFPGGATQPTGLVVDSSGNLYGGTLYPGAIYQLTPKPDGSWTYNLLYALQGGQPGPTSPLILDGVGNLYGEGVFELEHGSNGWTYIALCGLPQSHCSDQQGGPYGSPVFDTAGNLFATTEDGAAHGYGSVYELSPNSDGGWTETILHSFTFSEGYRAMSNLIFDSKGRLYGTTEGGGNGRNQGCQAVGCGVAFQLTPKPKGGWAFSVLHKFVAHTEGAKPSGLLELKGAFYGTLFEVPGGVFKLVHTSSGWIESTVFNFHNLHGESPVGGVISDSAGNLYGTAEFGGSRNKGVVYKLTKGPAVWRETVLHDFLGGSDFGNPATGLVFDHAGNLYGTTPNSVFITP
jgi:uncharacterized repeat protein (TIGR03803 family)